MPMDEIMGFYGLTSLSADYIDDNCARSDGTPKLTPRVGNLGGKSRRLLILDVLFRQKTFPRI